MEERHACPAKKLNTDQTAEPRIYYMNLHAHSAIQPKGRRTSSKRKIRIAGETSRSLMERSRGHYKDAEGFSKKSHMVKHWMVGHPDLNQPPPFMFRIVRQYRDCK